MFYDLLKIVKNNTFFCYFFQIKKSKLCILVNYCLEYVLQNTKWFWEVKNGISYIYIYIL